MTLSRRRVIALGAAMAFPAAPSARTREGSALSASASTLPLAPAPELVALQPDLPPGEVHVDPNTFSLYLTLGQGDGLRYACGIGRAELYEAGTFTVGAKKEWSSWTPTPGMIEREPEWYAQYADGLPGGPGNPLGARLVSGQRPDQGRPQAGVQVPRTACFGASGLRIS